MFIFIAFQQANDSFKMVQFPDEILRTAIRNTVKPETDLSVNVETLLLNMY